MVYIVNKRSNEESIKKRYLGAIIIDVTSTSKDVSTRLLSPFYPHRNIPIPFTVNMKATCVEAVWQGLKVFKDCDVDVKTFSNDTMKNIKRTSRKYGKPLGHRKGVYGKELLNYEDARKLIYLPTYKWMLDNVPAVHILLERITEYSKKSDIVFLDYNTNTDVNNFKQPLSHAGLLKLYIEGRYPSCAKDTDDSHNGDGQLSFNF
jgi:hypothetical protein